MGPDGRSRRSVGGGSGGADGRSPPLGRSPIADRLCGSAIRPRERARAARVVEAHGGGSSSSDAEAGGLVGWWWWRATRPRARQEERESEEGVGARGANSQAKPAGRDCHVTQLEKWGIICAARSRKRAIGSSPRAHQRGCTRATLPKARGAEKVGEWGRWRCRRNRTRWRGSKASATATGKKKKAVVGMEQ